MNDLTTLAGTKPSLTAAPSRARGRPAKGEPPVAGDEVLLARAFELFAARGYEGAAVRDIARQLGISHTLLRQRFGSKEDIWRRAVDARVERNSAQARMVFAAVSEPPEVRLSQLIRRFCEAALADPALINMLNVEACRDSARLDHLVDQFVRPFEQGLVPLLRAVAANPDAPINTVVFMSLLVNGAGTYFAADAMMRRVDPDQTAHADERITAFERALLAVARNG